MSPSEGVAGALIMKRIETGPGKGGRERDWPVWFARAQDSAG